MALISSFVLEFNSVRLLLKGSMFSNIKPQAWKYRPYKGAFRYFLLCYLAKITVSFWTVSWRAGAGVSPGSPQTKARRRVSPLGPYLTPCTRTPPPPRRLVTGNRAFGSRSGNLRKTFQITYRLIKISTYIVMLLNYHFSGKRFDWLPQNTETIRRAVVTQNITSIFLFITWFPSVKSQVKNSIEDISVE